MGHLQFIAGMSFRQARQHVAGAFDLWDIRNGTKWQLDLSVISAAGITLR